MWIDGATFTVFCPEHGKGGAIYQHVRGTQYRLIIHAPLGRASLHLQSYIYPALGSKITVKLAVAFCFFARWFLKIFEKFFSPPSNLKYFATALINNPIFILIENILSNK